MKTVIKKTTPILVSSDIDIYIAARKKYHVSRYEKGEITHARLLMILQELYNLKKTNQ